MSESVESWREATLRRLRIGTSPQTAASLAETYGATEAAFEEFMRSEAAIEAFKKGRSRRASYDMRRARATGAAIEIKDIDLDRVSARDFCRAIHRGLGIPDGEIPFGATPGRGEAWAHEIGESMEFWPNAPYLQCHRMVGIVRLLATQGFLDTSSSWDDFGISGDYLKALISYIRKSHPRLIWKPRTSESGRHGYYLLNPIIRLRD